MIKIKRILRKTGVIILTAAMLAGQTGFTALAEEVAEVEEAEDKALDNEDSSAEEQTTGGETEIEKEDTDSTKDTVSYDNADPEKESVSEDRAERKNFEESRTLSGVTITVEAEEDVFPEDSVLSVKKANYIKEKQADKAVEEERPEDQNVAVSYTYDIKVLDKDGNEIQPADEAEVKVSFKTEEVADDNLTTNVYHITEKEESRTENTEGAGSSEMVVEKLTVETKGDTATAETDGFSLYTVEFTYNDLQYVMPGDSEIALSEILNKVSLTGEVTRVEVSSPELFSAEKNDSGEWIVTAHKAFSSEEWMKVTINDKEYKITVTDDSNIMSFADLKAQLATGGEITLSKDYVSETNETGLVVPSGKTVILDLNDHYILYKGTGSAPVITVNGSLTLKDSKTPKTTRYVTLADGRATGVSESNTSGAIEVNGGFIAGGTLGGVNVGGTFTMEGGTITGCTGGGVYVGGPYVNGTFTMKDGTITGCSAANGGGVYVDTSSTFTMKGGTITGCSAANGGVVHTYGTFNMTGGSITDNVVHHDASNGGGVYVNSGTFNVSGAPVIRDNSGAGGVSNVVFQGDKTITVTGELTTGANICVNKPEGSTVAVGSTAHTITDTEAACFHSDLGNYDGQRIGSSPGRVVLGTPWESLQTWLNEDGETTHITLSQDYMSETTDTGLVVQEGKTVTLDLNGHYILYKGNTDSSVIKVMGSLTLKDSKTPKSTHYVTLADGRATGVSESNTSGAIEVTGGFIAGGNREDGSEPGGGVYVYDNATFTMESGTITGCKTDGGGGMAVDGTFNMTGGEITGCNGGNEGGGVNVRNGGTFNMTGGKITGNNAGYGGGVNSNGTFNMTGGEITGNNAISGGVVYIENGTFNVSGTPVIKNNLRNNVGFDGDAIITVTGALQTGAEIWVTANGSSVAVPGAPSGSSTAYTITAADVAKFHSDDRSLSPVLDNGNIKLVTAWSVLQAQFAAGGEITLSKDYVSETNETGLEVPSGKTVTLDLNDHYILYKGTANASVIKVSGTLTLKDSKTPKTTRYVTLADGRATGVSESNTSGAIEVTGGFIAGGNNVNQTGGGVYVNNSCMFTMEGGTIAGCKAGNGGGVNVNSSGMFTMEGGTIAGCKALSDGGGVFINNTGNFNMNGGSIKNCTATGSGDKRGGGSVYVSQSGKFNMEGGSITDCTADSGGGVYMLSGNFKIEGGSITDCTATSQGGGVYVYSGTFKVSGSPVIRDNKKGSDANNVALNNSKYITVTGALTTGAEIRVNASNGSTVAVPGAPSGSSPAYTITDTDAACFHSDLGAFTGGVHEGNVVFKEEVYISGISAENKVYDGNKSATVTGTATLKKVNGNADVSGLTVSNITAEFEDKNAGDNKAVTITGGTLSDIDNYILVPGATTGLTANITPKPLTITGLSAKDKTYDTTTAATVTGTSVINGKIGNDTVTVSAGTAAFDNANVGNNKTVTFSGFGLSGADSGNYILSAQPDNATANITKGTPTISTVPTVNAITYGQALSAVGFNGGVAKINGTEVTGSYAWVNGTITPSVSDSNRTGYDVRFTPTDTSNLNTTTCKVKLTVNKANPVVTPPAAKTGLEYTGLSTALVTQGSTTGGTMQYALGKNNTTAPSGGWSTVIPTGIDAGTYYVWSRIEGNANFNSIPAAFACSVSIAKNSHHPAVALDAVIRADDTREIDLSSGIEKGGAPGSPSKTDNDNIIDGSPTVNGKTLSFKAVNSEDIIDKSATITVPVENAKNYGTYNIVVTVKGIDKYTQELTFEKASVTLKAGETFTNGLSGAETNVSYKSSDEKVATVDSSGKVTAVNDGTATITATAEETEDYFSASAEYTVKVEGGAGDKVPLTDPGESYAAPEDNFAPVTSGGSGESGGDIKKLVLDFSNVAESNVDPAGLKMTVINGSKLVTKGKLKDKDSAKVSGGVKVKVDKKTLIPKITCKKSGSVTLTMEDGTTYTINFTVEKPKAQKAAKKVSKGGEPVTKTVTDLFGTHIDAGKLSIVKQKHSQARVMDNKLIVDPKEKDSIKLRYNYLNKKYNITIKIK